MADAYQTCANNTFFACDKYLSSQIDAFRTQKDYIFKKGEQDSVSRIEELDQIMEGEREDDKSVFMHQFHSESLQHGLDLLT